MDITRRSSNRFVWIDAQDSDIVYEGSWSDGLQGQEPVKSTISSDGSSASYTFHGIAFYMYGYIGPAGPPAPSISCYVDGTLVKPTPFVLAGKVDGINYWAERLLCMQDQLTDGNHTFKLVVEGATDAYPFMLDQLQFQLSSQQYENLAGIAGGNGSSSSVASSSATSSATTSPTNQASPSNSGGSSVAPIVGGVLGAILGSLLVGLGIWFVVRRRKQAYSKLDDDDLQNSGKSKIIPFMITRRRPPPSSPPSSVMTESEYPSEGAGPSTAAATFHVSPAPSVGSTPPPKVKKRVAAGLFNALGRARQRTDPEAAMSEIPSEAPPMYSADSNVR